MQVPHVTVVIQPEVIRFEKGNNSEMIRFDAYECIYCHTIINI